MATTLEYDLKVNSIGVQYGQQAAEEFTEALKGTQKASDDVGDSLEKQEARIKVLDGVINLLGGSVEVATGAIVGLGLASEENAEQFQSAALGAIAFADGAKRTLDGVKSLTEGLKAYGGVAGFARKVQASLNATVLANPYVLAAAAVAALAAGIYLLIKAQDQEIDTAKQLNDEYLKQQKNLEDLKDVREKVLAAQGETDIERLTRLKAENEQELKNARDRVEFYNQQKFQGEDLNNQLKIIREAKLQQPVLEAQLAAANKEANEKQREENKKTADEKAKQDAEALKAAEELRKARLASAQAGAEGLFALEQQLLQDLRNLRQAEIEKREDAFALFSINEETLTKIKADLLEKEGIIRQTRLAELDKTTAGLLKQNEDYFAKIIEGLGIGSDAYVQEEKKFQAVRAAILKADADARYEIEKKGSTEIYNVNFKLATMLNELAQTQGDKLLAVEDGTYADRKKAVEQYYDTVIAAARAANLAVTDLERQKAAALKGIDDQRNKEILDGAKSTLSTISSFLSQQRDIIDSQLQQELLVLGDNESAKEALRQKAFEKQKELRIAEATISGLTGAVDAFTSVQSLNKLVPGLGIAVGIALAGTVLGITAKQISLIQSSSMGNAGAGSGFNNAPSGGGGISLPTGGGISTAPSIGSTLPGIGGGRLAGAPAIGTVGQAPIQAYVLASDVSNGQQAAAAISNRRRLAGG